MKHLRVVSFYSGIISVVLLFSSCRKENTDADTLLYNEIKNASGFIYYKGDNTILQSSTQSGHSAYFRVRYNSTAYVALTDNGKLPVGATFANDAVVVKEIYSTLTGDLKKLVVMKKSSKPEAAQGWLWAEYNADGTVSVTLTNKGEACTGCHSMNSRDYNRLFDLFP